MAFLLYCECTSQWYVGCNGTFVVQWLNRLADGWLTSVDGCMTWASVLSGLVVDTPHAVFRWRQVVRWRWLFSISEYKANDDGTVSPRGHWDVQCPQQVVSCTTCHLLWEPMHNCAPLVVFSFIIGMQQHDDIKNITWEESCRQSACLNRLICGRW